MGRVFHRDLHILRNSIDARVGVTQVHGQGLALQRGTVADADELEFDCETGVHTDHIAVEQTADQTVLHLDFAVLAVAFDQQFLAVLAELDADVRRKRQLAGALRTGDGHLAVLDFSLHLRVQDDRLLAHS